MHIQDSQWATATASEGVGGAGRAAPLRVDAQRNLEHVLRAAREVFGELGYGAPMEDVARRARVGVGTVYRRFPSKDVLVRRIAQEETARLTEQARSALGQENEAWSALARFLRTSVASGAGRLLPPQVLRVRPAGGGADYPGAPGGDPLRVPQQRNPLPGAGAAPGPYEQAEQGDAAERPDHTGREDIAPASDAARSAGPGDRAEDEEPEGDDGIRTLLDVVGQLVERAREAGELRGDVSIADVLLVIATAAPALPDPAHQAAASARLLDILLEGLRSRPGERPADREAVEPAGNGTVQA
jgi:AcrR family transcriptional regulator